MTIKFTKDDAFILLLMFFCFGMMAANVDTVVPNLAVIKDSFGITAAQSQLSVGIFVAGAGLGQFIFGPIADAFGRKPGLLVGLGIHLFGSLLCTFAPNLETLLIGRLFQGVGTASAVVISRAILRDLYIDLKLARMLSFSFMMITPVPILSAITGYYLEKIFSWQAVFVVLMLYSGSFLLLVIFKFKETIKLRNPAAIQPRLILSGCKQVLVHPQSQIFVIVQLLLNAIMFSYVISAQRIFFETFEITGVLFSILYGAIGAAVLPGQMLNQILLKRTNTVTATIIALSIIVLSCVYGIVLYLIDHLHYAFFSVSAFFIVSCVLIGISNTVALIMNPHGQIAGVASSLLGFTGFLMGAILGTLSSIIYGANPMLMFFGMIATSAICLLAIWYWKSNHLEYSTQQS